MNENDLILQSFEIAGERAGDITSAVYRHYYARCPESRDVMSHVDEHMQGRMMEEVLVLAMTDPTEVPRDYLVFETGNHASYGVSRHMYTSLFHAVRDAVQEALGADWNEDYAAAWDARLAALLSVIDAVAPERPLLAM